MDTRDEVEIVVTFRKGTVRSTRVGNEVVKAFSPGSTDPGAVPQRGTGFYVSHVYVHRLSEGVLGRLIRFDGDFKRALADVFAGAETAHTLDFSFDAADDVYGTTDVQRRDAAPIVAYLRQFFDVPMTLGETAYCDDHGWHHGHRVAGHLHGTDAGEDVPYDVPPAVPDLPAGAGAGDAPHAGDSDAGATDAGDVAPGEGVNCCVQ